MAKTYCHGPCSVLLTFNGGVTDNYGESLLQYRALRPVPEPSLAGPVSTIRVRNLSETSFFINDNIFWFPPLFETNSRQEPIFATANSEFVRCINQLMIFWLKLALDHNNLLLEHSFEDEQAENNFFTFFFPDQQVYFRPSIRVVSVGKRNFISRILHAFKTNLNLDNETRTRFGTQTMKHFIVWCKKQSEVIFPSLPAAANYLNDEFIFFREGQRPEAMREMRMAALAFDHTRPTFISDVGNHLTRQFQTLQIGLNYLLLFKTDLQHLNWPRIGVVSMTYESEEVRSLDWCQIRLITRVF